MPSELTKLLNKIPSEHHGFFTEEDDYWIDVAKHVLCGADLEKTELLEALIELHIRNKLYDHDELY